MSPNKSGGRAFALYEVLLGVTIFAVGVLALGYSVQNCMNANALSAEDDRVRRILADRMAEIQATPGYPDNSKQTKIDTGYGEVLLVQKSAPAGLKGENNTELSGINLVTLSAVWKRSGVPQSRRIQFYIFRNG
jgi:Tfp pilus assembly protein PilV